MKRGQSLNLTEGSILKQLILFSLPILVGQVFQTLYHSVDSIVVGNSVGTNALAAVTASAPVADTLSGFFNGLSAGASVLFSRHFGAKEYGKLHHSIHATMLFSMILGLVMASVGILLTSTLLGIVNCPEAVFFQAKLYLQIYLIGVFFTSIYNISAGVLRSVGNSQSPFYYLVISSCLNIVLDILFVSVLKIGVSGVAIATVISQFVSVLLSIRRMQNMPESYRFKFNEMRPDFGVLKQITGLGLPAGVQSSLISISSIFIQRYINGFSAAAVAGVGAGMRIDQFAGMPCHALGLAMTTFIGQNVGAKRYDRTFKGVRVSVIIVAVLICSLGIPMYFFAPSLARIFGSDPDMIEMCVRFLRTILPLYLLMGMNGLIGGIVRGYGYSMTAMIISLIGIVAVRQIWLAVSLSRNHVIENIFIGYPIGWIATIVPMLVFFFAVICRKYKVRDNIALNKT